MHNYNKLIFNGVYGALARITQNTKKDPWVRPNRKESNGGPVGSHSGSTLFVCQNVDVPQIQLQTVSGPKTFFLVNSAYTTMFSMRVFMCRDPGDTTSKFHVVPSLLSVLNTKKAPLKISLPENENMVNLKSTSFVIIIHLHEGLTPIHSEKKV